MNTEDEINIADYPCEIVRVRRWSEAGHMKDEEWHVFSHNEFIAYGTTRDNALAMAMLVMEKR